ncbi:MAG: hypothetical protein ACRDJH_10210 [Thermomicrobiales bacterium]
MLWQWRPASLIESLTMTLSVTVSLAAVAGTWIIIPAEDAVGVIVRIAATLVVGSGIGAALAFARGSSSGLFALWIEIGMLAAIVIPALLSVGVLYLGAAALLSLCVAMMPSTPEPRSLHHLDVLAGAFEFIVIESALLAASFV